MRYVGGKVRISKWIAEHVAAHRGERSIYLEPFLGGGGTFERIAPTFATAKGGDTHPDLMLMWQAIADGWDPPERVSRELYEELRDAAEPSALRGFVGFGSTWGGKWFGGYVDSVWDTHNIRMTVPYATAARASLIKAAPVMRDAILRHCSYSEWSVTSDYVVYCDPPYQSTHGYKDTQAFNTEAFLATAAEWTNTGALVLISEQREYEGWTVLAERQRKAMMRVPANGGENEVRRELLLVRSDD